MIFRKRRGGVEGRLEFFPKKSSHLVAGPFPLPTNWSYQTLSESSFSLMSSGLCDVIWSTALADKGAAVEPKDFSCVNRHLRNIKYAEGHSRVAICHRYGRNVYIFMIWEYWGQKPKTLKAL